MKAHDLRDWIDSLTDDIEFQYLGVWGSICPFNRHNISVSYGDNERTFYSVDDVMNEPFILGKTIKDICGEFVI
jgi:hypothetical protein